MARLLPPPLAALFFLSVILSASGAPPALAAEAPAYIAIGDSLAFGVGTPEPHRDGYVALVYDALLHSDRYGERGLDLVNLGVPGATSADLLLSGGQVDAAVDEVRARQEDTSSSDDNVEIISVNIGGNDLLSLATPTSPCYESVTDDECRREFGRVLAGMQSNLSEAVQRLRDAAPDAGIYVMDLYNPYSGTGHELEAVADLAVQNLNGIIGAITADQSLKVHQASVFQLFLGRGPQWIAADGIHANEKGHRVMAEVLLATIDDREPHIPQELLDETPAPAASPANGPAPISPDGDSGIPWVVWVLLPAAFAGGALVAGAYFWARGRA